MQTDVTAVRLFDFTGAVDVIEMGMGVHDRPHGEIVVRDDLGDTGSFAAGIDHDCIFAISARQDAAITLERTGRECFEEQHAVQHVAYLQGNARIRRVAWPVRALW